MLTVSRTGPARIWPHHHVRKSLRRKSTRPVVESEVVIDVGGGSEPIHLTFGKLARFADGSCVASQGHSSVLVTAVSPEMNDSVTNPAAFVPLTVDYRQKSAAAGRIPTNFLRREMGPSDTETLTSRLIDRAIRPLFPKGFSGETHISANLLAVDAEFDPVVLALNAASSALATSRIPWNGPLGGVRVGYAGGKFLLNPRRRYLFSPDNQLNLVVAGTSEGYTLMLEADAKNLDPGLFLDGISFGLEGCANISQKIQSEKASRGEVKRQVMAGSGGSFAQTEQDVANLCEQKLRQINCDLSHDKTTRSKATFSLRDAVVEQLKKEKGTDPAVTREAFTRLCRKSISDLAIDDCLRVDGRSAEEIREISCEVDLHKPLHGSALFQRGQTQVFCTVALDSPESALKTDALSALTGGIKEKNFFLHYEFPPYATNEIGKSSHRRELGHGALAEKALRPVVPSDHPFTVRLTSEVLESNGSSSMASVCGGSMALMDAGVPITMPAAGVALGLVSRPSSRPPPGSDLVTGRDYKVLLDIMGLEDFLGDMDFKLAGTKQGVTALQADTKLPGLPFHVVKEALHKGHKGISSIVDIMERCISTPKKSKANWPVSQEINVPAHLRAKFLGSGGINLKRLMVETGVTATASPNDQSVWKLFGPNSEAMAEATTAIDAILNAEKTPEFEFGAIYPVRITELLESGVKVELHPTIPPVFVPNSQLDTKKVMHPSAVGLEAGQEIQVKYFGRDSVSGAVRLSRKVLMAGAASTVKQLRSSIAANKLVRLKEVEEDKQTRAGSTFRLEDHPAFLAKDTSTSEEASTDSLDEASDRLGSLSNPVLTQSDLLTSVQTEPVMSTEQDLSTTETMSVDEKDMNLEGLLAHDRWSYEKEQHQQPCVTSDQGLMSNTSPKQRNAFTNLILNPSSKTAATMADLIGSMKVSKDEGRGAGTGSSPTSPRSEVKTRMHYHLSSKAGNGHPLIIRMRNLDYIRGKEQARERIFSEWQINIMAREYKRIKSDYAEAKALLDQSREDSRGTSMTRLQHRLHSELDSIADECVKWYSQWLKFSSRQIVIFRLLANNKFFDEVKKDVNDVIARLQAELPETMESQNYDADLRRIYQDVFHLKMQKLEGRFLHDDLQVESFVAGHEDDNDREDRLELARQQLGAARQYLYGSVFNPAAAAMEMRIFSRRLNKKAWLKDDSPHSTQLKELFQCHSKQYQDIYMKVQSNNWQDSDNERNKSKLKDIYELTCDVANLARYVIKTHADLTKNMPNRMAELERALNGIVKKSSWDRHLEVDTLKQEMNDLRETTAQCLEDSEKDVALIGDLLEAANSGNIKQFNEIKDRLIKCCVKTHFNWQKIFGTITMMKVEYFKQVNKDHRRVSDSYRHHDQRSTLGS